MKFPINKIIFFYLIISIGSTICMGSKDSKDNAQKTTKSDYVVATNQVNTKKQRLENNVQANKERQERLNFFREKKAKEITELVMGTQSYEYISDVLEECTQEVIDRAKYILLQKYRKELYELVRPGIDSLNKGAIIKFRALKNAGEKEMFVTCSQDEKLAVTVRVVDQDKLVVSDQDRLAKVVRLKLLDITDINNEKSVRDLYPPLTMGFMGAKLGKNGLMLLTYLDQNSLFQLQLWNSNDKDKTEPIYDLKNIDLNNLRCDGDLTENGNLALILSSNDRKCKAIFLEIYLPEEIRAIIENYLPSVLTSVISGYFGSGVTEINRFEFESNVPGMIRFSLASDGSMALINRVILCRKSNKFLQEKLEINGNLISEIKISPDGRYVLIEPHHHGDFGTKVKDEYHLLNTNRFCKEGFVPSSDPIKCEKAIFSNDGKFILGLSPNTGSLLLNRINGDGEIKQISTSTFPSYSSSCIVVREFFLGADCRFALFNLSYGGAFLDIENTWIMDQLDPLQLAYVIKLHRGIGNYTDADIDKIFANTDPRFVKHLKSYFTLRS